MKFLYAAYIITWAVHLGYIVYLTRAFAKLREEVRELERE